MKRARIRAPDQPLQPPKTIAASLLPVVAALLFAEFRRRQPLELPFEIDLSRRPPAFVQLVGFSGAEAWGRWTDGREARLVLPRRLPACLELEIQAKAFGPNAGESLTIEAGQSTTQVRLSGELERRRLMLCGLLGASELRFRVPRPTSPRSLDLGDDGRRLGIGVARISLRALPLAPSGLRP